MADVDRGGLGVRLVDPSWQAFDRALADAIILGKPAEVELTEALSRSDRHRGAIVAGALGTR